MYMEEEEEEEKEGVHGKHPTQYNVGDRTNNSPSTHARFVIKSR